MIQSVDLMYSFFQMTVFMPFLKMRAKLLLKIIPEDYNVRVNTNRAIWEGRAIKINQSDLPQYSNYLKLIWINSKRKKWF